MGFFYAFTVISLKRFIEPIIPMRNDSTEILSLPVSILININVKSIVKNWIFFLNLLRYTLRARITNPRDRVQKNNENVK